MIILHRAILSILTLTIKPFFTQSVNLRQRLFLNLKFNLMKPLCRQSSVYEALQLVYFYITVLIKKDRFVLDKIFCFKTM